MDYLFDTNLLLLYLRRPDLRDKVEQILDFQRNRDSVILSVVSTGEIKSLAIQNKWGSQRVAKLETLLQQFLIADINVRSIIERYAEIDAFSQGKLPDQKVSFTARKMGKNNLWIAATTSVLEVPLVTLDRDFDHLHSSYLSLQKIDLKEIIK